MILWPCCLLACTWLPSLLNPSPRSTICHRSSGIIALMLDHSNPMATRPARSQMMELTAKSMKGTSTLSTNVGTLTSSGRLVFDTRLVYVFRLVTLFGFMDPTSVWQLEWYNNLQAWHEAHVGSWRASRCWQRLQGRPLHSYPLQHHLWDRHQGNEEGLGKARDCQQARQAIQCPHGSLSSPHSQALNLLWSCLCLHSAHVRQRREALQGDLLRRAVMSWSLERNWMVDCGGSITFCGAIGW